MIEMEIREGDEVVSADGYDLGVARSLHYRPADEVNADEQLYAVYLKVVNYELGDEFFIPVDFLQMREDKNEPVTLTVPVKFVQRRAWSRAPDFVAHSLGRTERLHGAEQTPAI